MLITVITLLLLHETWLGGGDLRRRRWRRRRAVLIEFDMSHASQLLWSCSRFPDSHMGTWWHLYRGALPIWFACFKWGWSNLIFQTVFKQTCLLKFDPQVWSHWSRKEGDERPMRTFFMNEDILHHPEFPWNLQHKFHCISSHPQRKSVLISCWHLRRF